MSDAHEPLPVDQPEGQPPPPPHRAASMTLRARDPRRPDDSSLLDPANQSLADALRITFRVLQGAMVVLLALFLLSGFQSVQESESGVRLLFGRRTADNLPPGFRFSAPYPIGELIKVQTGTVTLEVDESFFPKLREDQKRLSMQQLANIGKTTLRPGEDGSLITADQNIAHTRWKAVYRREEPGRYAERVYPEHEPAIVRAAVERGVVQAIAQVTIDDLLKQSSGDSGSVAVRAHESAQRMLDTMGSGIRIDQLTLEDKTPPLPVYGDFSNVQAAEQRASQRREQAQSESRNILTSAAGGAYPHLIDQISRFERAVDLQDRAEQAALLARINALLAGHPVEIDGVSVPPLVSGKVTATLNEAHQYRSNIVNRKRAELAAYTAKLEQFRTNPDVVLQRDWADAMTIFLGRETVETMTWPVGAEALQLVVNRDPFTVKEWERVRKQQENLRLGQQRQERQLEGRFRTDTEARGVGE